jgi:hypothetical protein
MKTAEALKEHAFLERMVGDWTVAASDMTGDKPWDETVRSLQGIWFVAEGAGETSDGKQATTILTLGYDSSKSKYVGSWIGSMMDYMWIYEGEIEPSGNVLSLYTRGLAFEGDGLADYREQIAFLDDNVRTFTSSVKEADGTWKQFMEVKYTRKG